MRRRIGIVAATLGTLLVVSGAAAGQSGQLGARDRSEPASTGDAAISGRVTSAADGQPIPRAMIALHSDNGRVNRRALTDREGRYAVTGLPAGRYFLHASAVSYVAAHFGQRHPDEGGTLLVIGGRQRRAVDFALQRGAVIAGIVTDELGVPVPQASVQAHQLRHDRDGRRPVPQQTTTSDDRGMYRIYGLPPADYLVSAELRTAVFNTPGEPPPTYAPAFHPGTHDAEHARPLALGVGDERFLPLMLVPGRLLRISGQVITAGGQPAPGAQIALAPTGGGRWVNSRGRDDGSFVLDGVPRGDHTIIVRLEGGEAPEAASVRVRVDAVDLDDVRITTSRGGTVTGRVVFEGDTPRPPAPLRVYPAPVNRVMLPALLGPGAPDRGLVGLDGRFALTGIVGAMVPMLSVQGWMLRSVTHGGRDISEDGLDPSAFGTIDGVVITLTDRLTRLSGAVRDARSRPTIDAVIVVLPEGGRTRGPLRSDPIVFRPDTDGRFDVAGLAPGRYAAAAVEWLEPGTHFDPAVQQRLRQAGRPFSLDEGQTLTLDLSVTASR